MATEQFASVDDITAHYDKQIKGAGDDELSAANLRAERAERVAEFKDREARTVQHRAWVSEAIAKHGIPAELSDMIEKFDTPEAIDKAAQRLAEIRAGKPSAADVYGGSTAGSGAPPAVSKDPEGEWLTQFEADWNSREPRPARDFQRYAEIRLGRHAFRAMKSGAGKKHIWQNVADIEVDRY